MYTVGVVGPSSSVNRILALSSAFNKRMQFLSFPYSELKQTAHIVQQNDDKVDMWMFSGKISYMKAKAVLQSDHKLFYIEHTESGIYKALLQMAYFNKTLVHELSIDEITITHLERAFDQLSLKPNRLYFKSFNEHTNLIDVVQFHMDLWKQNKTKGALTCFEEVYSELKTAGVPVYRITPSELEIRQALKILAEKATALYFKGTQISVQIVEVEHIKEIIGKSKSAYDLQYLELKLKEILVRLCEAINGSLADKGLGHYLIISSRGAIEQKIASLKTAVNELALETDTAIAVGIGHGENVYAAEMNAYRAIQLSKERPSQGPFIVQEDGVIVEAAGEKQQFAYSTRMDNKDLIKRLKQSSINIKKYNQIIALTKAAGKSAFTVKELAEKLHWDQRNTRRLVKNLCEIGLAKYIGEEGNTSRGRPGRIYNFATFY